MVVAGGAGRRYSPGRPLASEVMIDYMSKGWKAGGYTAGLMPLDGEPHQDGISAKTRM